MSALAEWNENGRDVTASEQYKEKLKAHQTRFKRDRSAYCIRFSCIHNGLLGEFEGCPTAKDRWGRLKIQFGQTSATRLCALRLKWM